MVAWSVPLNSTLFFKSSDSTRVWQADISVLDYKTPQMKTINLWGANSVSKPIYLSLRLSSLTYFCERMYINYYEIYFFTVFSHNFEQF